MADMQELIARLEAAEAGSRELDVAIRDALIPDGAANDFNFHTGFADRPETHGVMRVRIVEEYTTSLDAALALAERVLPGYAMNVCLDKDRDGTLLKWSSQVARYGLSGPVGRGGWWFGIAPTPAVALCIAIIKAKAQGEGGHG